MSQPQFDQDSEIGKVIHSWFHKLQENPGKRAELRRCKDLDEVFFCQGFWELRNAIAGIVHAGLGKKRRVSIAALAGLLAGASAWPTAMASMGKAFAHPGDNEEGLSALRFRRLLTHQNIGDLYIPLGRALKQIKYKFPPGVLARDLLDWDENTKKRWALDYYSQLNQSKN